MGAGVILFLLSLTLSTAKTSTRRSSPSASFSAKAIPGFCSKSDAHFIANYFHAMEFDHSSCPSRGYLIELSQVDASPDKIFIDVGANKGYNFATMYSLWAPHLQITPKRWHATAVNLSTFPASDLEGHCRDENEELTSPSASPGVGSSTLPSQDKDLKLLAIDLSIGALNLITEIVTALSQQQLTPSSSLHITTLHTAMSNHDGVTHVGNCHLSLYERCSIDPLAKYAVPVTTIDHLWSQLPTLLNITEERGRQVDILMIDAEGSDALVLEGAVATLSQRFIRLLIFEYHGECPWPVTSLHRVLQTLYQQGGYVCYYEGQNRLWRLTGCWSSLYEIYTWSNVVCIHPSDRWYPILEGYRVTAREAKIFLVAQRQQRQQLRTAGDSSKQRKPKEEIPKKVQCPTVAQLQ
jgi:hypothetical protein